MRFLPDRSRVGLTVGESRCGEVRLGGMTSLGMRSPLGVRSPGDAACAFNPNVADSRMAATAIMTRLLHRVGSGIAFLITNLMNSDIDVGRQCWHWASGANPCQTAAPGPKRASAWPISK